MLGEDKKRLEAVLLSLDDIEEIFALYELTRATTPYGFLALRTEQSYRALFRDPDGVIASGIRDNGRLIAHSICHRLAKNPYKDNAILGAFDPVASMMYHGDGTVVHPGYQGRMLAQRLARLRQHEMAARRIEHMVGLVAVDNLVSIGNVLHSGALLVGFARDETSMNFVAYGGRLRARLQTEATPIEVGWRDHERQGLLFARRHSVHGLARRIAPRTSTSAGEGDRRFSFRPVA